MKILTQSSQAELQNRFARQINPDSSYNDEKQKQLSAVDYLMALGNPRAIKDMRKSFKNVIKDGFSKDSLFKLSSSSFGLGSNDLKGSHGENALKRFLKDFDDSWVLFSNIYLPKENQLTEIDLALIGVKGVFLIEVKSWRGSYSANKDFWKMRQGSEWQKLQDSPTKQSKGHLLSFLKWISPYKSQLPSFYVYAPVFFSCADWIGVKECCVPVFSRLSELTDYINSSKTQMTYSQIELITNLITDYH